MPHRYQYRLFAIIVLMMTALTMRATAQTDSLDASAPRISLITCSPGSEIYELCGHTALRVRIGANDIAVNYGTFDFRAPNFVYRFVKGETDYMVSAYPWAYFIDDYSRAGRGVYEQPLLLTPTQAQRLVELLEVNLRPENRVYHYNYVKDNCSTRPLAIIEQAIGDSLVLTAPASAPAGPTFRRIMQAHHRGYPWYQFGIDLALGPGLDQPVDARAMAFAPMLLHQMIDSATTATGHRRVAAASITLVEPTDDGGPLQPTPWFLTPLAVSLAVLALCLVVSVADTRRRHISRRVDAIVMGVNGAAGCVIAFLVFVSTHEASSPNWVLMWLNPLCFIVPAMIYIKKCNKFVKWYEFVNFALLIALIVIWCVGVGPANVAFIPLLAADLVLTIRYLYLTRNASKK